MQLTIKEKPRQLCWGLGAFEDLCDELGITLQQLELEIASNETVMVSKLTYAALRNGAEINDDSLDFNYKYFLNWLDNEPQGTGDEIMVDFMRSKIQGVTMQQRYDEMIAKLLASEPEETRVNTKKKSTRSEKSSAMPISGD